MVRGSHRLIMPRFTPEGMRNSVMLNVLVVMVGLTFFAGALDTRSELLGELVGP